MSIDRTYPYSLEISPCERQEGHFQWSIRERGKLKRKVRAISTEGRMSAYILTAVPCLLGASIMVLMPHFYTSVWDEPMTWYLLGASFVWLILGNAMMFKMSNFKF